LSVLPSVAIVILNYNGNHLLQQFLPFVLQSTYINKKVIVADNASTDESVNWLQQNYSIIKIIKLPCNYGFAKGYNEALKQIEADYYVLLNSDIEVSLNWIEPIIELMESDKMIAACQPKILSYKQRDMFEYAGAGGGWIDRLGYPFARGRIFNICEEDKGQYDTTEEVFWASGAAMFLRATAYYKIKGLDNYFFAHQEEIDLCWRLQLEGYKIVSCPSSVVYHVGGGTMSYKDKRKAFLNHRNNLIMLYKNMPIKTLLWLIPFRVWLDGTYALINIFSGNYRYTFSVIKAQVGFFKWALFYRRQSIFPVKRRKIFKGIFKGSIVWGFFWKKKKTFKEIITQTSIFVQ